jgi:glutamate-1-semialdehyde 2,1-aminomutase
MVLELYRIAAILGLAAAGALLLVELRRWFLLRRARRSTLWTQPPIANLAAKLIRYYGFEEPHFFAADGAPTEIAAARRSGFETLARELRARAPKGIALGETLAHDVSDAAFTSAYRVPFQFREHVRRELPVPSFFVESHGARLKDVDGNWSYDLAGSYGVNLFGYDFYKDCIERGALRVRELGPVLGPYHPVVAENAATLKRISGLDEVSFHMSGTEAVMQAVRLARFHTRRRRIVTFAGAYHGWWDGVQQSLVHGIPAQDRHVLEDMSDATLKALSASRDIACVLVNPVQAMHPGAGAPGDGMLIDSSRDARFDKAAYTAWLRNLRRVCTARSIVLIVDEVFVGFRLALGGAQEFFGIAADMVTYGKTLGGGLPIGVVCGKRELMQRFDPAAPARLTFARGTFNAHPYVMGAMSEFLRHLETSSARAVYANLEERWNTRAEFVNARLDALDLPVRIVNLVSIWTVIYTRPSRYNWMLQYYLRAEGLVSSWIGTGRLIFPNTLGDDDFDEIARRFVTAVEKMRADDWWWQLPSSSNRRIRRRVLHEMVRAAWLSVRGSGLAAPAPQTRRGEKPG